MPTSKKCSTGFYSATAVAVVLLLGGGLLAQDAAPARDADGAPAENRANDQQREPVQHPQEVPRKIAEDFAGPDPERPWGPPYYLDADPYADRRERARRFLRPTHGPRYYYDDYTYRFGVPSVYDEQAPALERVYRQGVADGRNVERFEIQAQRGFYTYHEAMMAGDEAFMRGHYPVAARHFRLAARLNQSDPTSRLSFAQTMIALGHYEEAARSLRRAFDLQPKIAYLPLDIRGAYGRPADFSEHLDRLRRAVEVARDDDTADEARLQFVLGYALFFSVDPVEGANAYARAARLQRGDRVYRHLAEVSRQSVPAHALRATEQE